VWCARETAERQGNGRAIETEHRTEPLDLFAQRVHGRRHEQDLIADDVLGDDAAVPVVNGAARRSHDDGAHAILPGLERELLTAGDLKSVQGNEQERRQQDDDSTGTRAATQSLRSGLVNLRRKRHRSSY
jgi:hypothetical protein